MRIKALASALFVLLALLVVAPARGASAAGTLRFVAPTSRDLTGTTDLQVDAPDGTTAVRFFLDGIQLSELTDLYARQTHSAPVWMTATDAGWFAQGAHTLRAEADTATGAVVATEQVVTHAPASGPGVTPLDGAWHFTTAGDLPPGDLDGASPPEVQSGYDDSAWPTIVVPDSFGAVRARWNVDSGLLGVYRRTVSIDRPDPLQRTALVFDSCFWSCHYFVNGTDVGSSTGGYLPTRLDVTDAVRAGTNAIAVVVDNRVSTLGQYAVPVQGLYWNWGGILQQVHLERTPAAALTETRAEGALDGTLTLRPSGVNATGTPQTVRAMVSVNAPDGTRVFGPTPVETVIPSGGGASSPITLHLADPLPWDLDHPNLYTVHLHPLGDAAWRDLVEQTGFRDIAVRGMDLLLNGKPVNDLAGFDRHADYPGLGRTQPDGLADREIKALHDKGFRIFRPAHYPTTPAELAAADRYGLLVIEEINNITSLGAATLGKPDVHDYAKSVLTRMVARDRSHPSLFAWSVGNENATDTDAGADYVRDVISYGKTIDPTRVYTQVTDHPTTDRAYPYEDFLAENYYGGWYSSTVDSVGPLLDNIQASTGKPIMISEYGAEAVAGRTGTDRGGEWYQASIVDGYNRQLNNRPHFIGKMYWTSTEFWCTPTWSGGNPDPVPPFHTKALETYDRQPKLGWRVMFSPVRITNSTVLAAPLDQNVSLREQVTLADVSGHGAHGTVVVDAPTGFTAAPVPFSVAPNGSATVDVMLRGTLRADTTSSGYIRAVINSDTEALPMPFTIGRADTLQAPASDDFGSPMLDAGWQVVRPDGSGWSLTDRPGSLRLSTLPGGEAGPNLFVRTTTPEADYTATAGVDAAALSADGQQIGLYAYADDGNYAEIDLGRAGGHGVLEFAAASGGKLGAPTSVPYSDSSAQLRLVRHGTDISGEYSSDGQNWYALGTATLSGTARVALQATGAQPASAYVDDLDVRTSGVVSVVSANVPAQPLFNGEPGQADVVVENGTASAVDAQALLDVPSGWIVGDGTASVPPFGRTTLEVPVTPSGPPAVATLTAHVSGASGQAQADVVSVPKGDQVPFALDAGTPTSALVSTFTRLSQADSWDPVKGFGWTGSAPQSRDRGSPDDLRRDIVTNTAPGTLRISVPAGQHAAYLLVGDASFPADAMTVSSGGQTLVDLQSPLATGTFRWLPFTVDGGAAGQDVDLDFTAHVAGQYWRFAALVLT